MATRRRPGSHSLRRVKIPSPCDVETVTSGLGRVQWFSFPSSSRWHSRALCPCHHRERPPAHPPASQTTPLEPLHRDSGVGERHRGAWKLDRCNKNQGDPWPRIAGPLPAVKIPSLIHFCPDSASRQALPWMMDDGRRARPDVHKTSAGILAFRHGKNENRIPVASLLAEHLQRQNLKNQGTPAFCDGTYSLASWVGTATLRWTLVRLGFVFQRNLLFPRRKRVTKNLGREQDGIVCVWACVPSSCGAFFVKWRRETTAQDNCPRQPRLRSAEQFLRVSKTSCTTPSATLSTALASTPVDQLHQERLGL